MNASALSPNCKLLVVKVAERCNLNCSYCYMYNGGDRSYLKRPALMSQGIVEAMIYRVREHCDKHKINDFAFVFHGGEPMMAKPGFYEHFTAFARKVLEPDVNLIFAIQTNGTLFNDKWCETLKELGIRVSFSLDGPKAVNDRFRIDRKGRGSFDKVMEGWQLAKDNGLNPGLLLVVNVQSNPMLVYQLIREMEPSTVDFLLPDATYDKPPLGYETEAYDNKLYANWLLKIFNRWYDEAVSEEVPEIRMFLQVMRALMGKQDGYDVLGRGKIEVLVIESDGEIQPLDGLRFCEDGIADTALNVVTNALDDAYQLPLINLYYNAHDDLAHECLGCQWRDVCGGGFLPHRYKKQNGFKNPSLYCQDMFSLISQIHARVEAEL